MRKWVFWDDGDHSPAFNMAADEMLMQWHREGRIAPVLRFYGWNPGGFSVGYFQKTKKFNFEEIEKRGFELVRRPTGGQAVLHHQELTYSIIVSEDYPGVPSTIKDAYKVLSQGLLRSGLKAWASKRSSPYLLTRNRRAQPIALKKLLGMRLM